MSNDPDSSRPRVDYRMSFAAERTFLAYIRTALALLASGIAIVGALPDVGHEQLRRVMGVMLVVAGLVTAAGARPRWRRFEAAMRAGDDLPASAIGMVIVVAVVVAGALALVLIARV